MLLVGDRVVLRSPSPPDVEYALFEIADIELRASEPGRVREHGYQTTAERARSRLAQLGIVPALARECASAMQPTIADAYSRGPAVRHVARYLGPTELFQSDIFEPVSQTYRGVFLDLPVLVHDLDLPAAERASATIQALYLAALLDAEAPDTTVFLSTDGWTRHRKPGERTHKRPQLGHPRNIAQAIGELARLEPRPDIQEQLARADVLAFLRARADASPDDDARALYQSLERAISTRDIPDRGPLSDPALWAIESRLDAGQLDGIMIAVEEVERTHGRTPGTTYLRARASLALALEPPKLVAERISALALSMTSFQELSLLAAEAWLAAGDARRAVPYARDLVDAPGIEEGLLLRAQRLLARAVGAAPEGGPQRAPTYADVMHPGPLPPSAAPPPLDRRSKPVSAPELHAAKQFEPAQSRVPTQKGGVAASSGPETPPAPPASEPAPQRASSLPPRQRPAVAEVQISRPPPLDLELTPPPMMSGVPASSFTVDLPGPDTAPSPGARKPIARGDVATERDNRPPVHPRGDVPTERDAEARPPRTSKRPSAAPSARQRGGLTETRPPPGFDPRAEPGSDPAPKSDAMSNKPTRRFFDSDAPPSPAASHPPPAARARPSQKPSRKPPPPVPSSPPRTAASPKTSAPPPRTSTIPRRNADRFMRGASLPPYRTESPAPLLPKAPLLPRLSTDGDELVEHLPLPPGIGAESMGADVLPRSVLEARVQFTMLARELGLDYRLKRGIDLRADVSGIEAMQSVLLDSFPDHAVRSEDEAYEVRRHGALLSEILARHLEAEWIDITPDELGHWAMIVPPDTRVWPFGRVLRLVAMGHRERDLVSYFLELETRHRPR